MTCHGTRSVLLLGLTATLCVRPASSQDCAAASTIRDTSRVIALLRESFDRDSARSENAWTAFRALDSSAVPALLTALCGGRPGSVDYDMAMRAGPQLARMGNAGIEALVHALASDDTTLANNARMGLEPFDSTADPTPYLIPLLDDRRPRVREAAAGSLRLLGPNPSQASEGIRKALADPDSMVRWSAVSNIYGDNRDGRPWAPELRAALHDPSPRVRWHAALALGGVGASDSTSIATLVAVLRSDPDTDVRGVAARALGWLGGAASASVPALIEALQDRVPGVRMESAAALGDIGSDTATNQLEISRALSLSLGDQDSTMRMLVARSLRQIGAAARAQNLAALDSKDPRVRISAIRALGEQPPTPAVIADLSKLLATPDLPTRTEAIAALGGFGPDVLPRLQSMASGSDKRARDGVMRVREYLARVDSLPLANGCYRLQLAKWEPTMDIGDDTIFSTPPSIVFFSRLKNEWFAGRGDVSYRILPANGAHLTVHGPGFWTPMARVDSVSIVWSTGFSGLTMTLGVTPDTLSGSAQTFWDFGRTRQTAKVLGVRVACQQ